MKKISTVAAKQNRNFTEQKLTIGFDLGDRSSWYCVLDEMGNVLLEQRLSTTPKAIQEVFGARCPRFTPVLWALTWDCSVPLQSSLKFSQAA